MAKQSPEWTDILDEALGEFQAVSAATPAWLEVPGAGRRLMVDRLYPQLGLVVQLHRDQSGREQLLDRLCRQVGVTPVFLDAGRHPSSPELDQLCAVLSRTMRRLAQTADADEAKQTFLPRMATARAVLQRWSQTLQPVPEPAAETAPAGRERFRRLTWRERWQQQLLSNWRRFRGGWQLFRQNRLAVLGLVLLALYGLAAIAYPILRSTVWSGSMYDPRTGFDFLAAPHPSPPSWLPRSDNPYAQRSFDHILGTDALGHDVLSMLLAATRPAFVIGITAALSTALVSILMGALSAYFGGLIDRVIMQIADVFLLLPAPLFMVIFGVLFQKAGSVSYGLVYGLVAGLGGAAIVMRSYALSLVNKPFIDASRLAGGGGLHIIMRHMVPHMLPLAALYMMISVVGAVVADGFISFFGFSRSYINWGTIIYTSFSYQSFISSDVVWNVFLPASLALSFFAASFYLVARGLHQVADPRLRRA